MTTQPADDESETLHVDKTPDGHARQAAQPSGEVFTEYGIVDLNATFPAESYDWVPEFPDSETIEEHDIDDPDHADVEEHHVVVPFRVVKRGISNRSHAQRVADDMNAEFRYERYRVVQLSDTRGL